MTPKQQRFVEEYLKDLNATQACIRAGYSARTADRIGPELLGKTCVAEAIQAAKAERSKRTEITQDRVLQELARIAFGDVRAIFHPDGRLKRPEELDDDAAASIASIEVVTVSAGEGVVEHVAKIKRSDKTAALTLLARHLGMLNDKLQLDVTQGLGDRLARARARRVQQAKQEGEAS